MSAVRAVLSPPLMTVNEFLDWPGDGAGGKYDLVDGAPRLMSPAVTIHSTIQATAAALLRNHLKATRRPCRVATEAAIIPRSGDNINLRVPDVVVACSRPEKGERVMADPLLIIEVLSPSNERETRDNVWTYLSIPSLRDILLLRSDRMAAEIISRPPDGDWPDRRLAVAATDQVVLPSLEFAVPLAAFYEDTYLLDEA